MEGKNECEQKTKQKEIFVLEEGILQGDCNIESEKPKSLHEDIAKM